MNNLLCSWKAHQSCEKMIINNHQLIYYSKDISDATYCY